MLSAMSTTGCAYAISPLHTHFYYNHDLPPVTVSDMCHE
ncbi:hypothetical protein GXM_00803 [Nostoc sphaeroides CCNUC1]|uniref:Uncharacterized protein n=1 Tax=Nostoc sphaeroides CCNUC1 TaxID=2653204 RepID=A0A5P8VSK1_9NOSO|nr:hypothetical protein GXM_00803 [Nostoc sphaeroides CCNUC1]